MISVKFCTEVRAMIMRMAKVHSGEDWRNIAASFNSMSRAHERYRETTDDRQTVRQTDL